MNDSADGNGQRDILLAEDDARDAEMTRRALATHNLANRLAWVKDGAEALDYLLHRGAYAPPAAPARPALVLLDLKMPKVDGLEVLTAIKADPQLRTIPVVVMTSSAEERDLVESYRLGVNSYVVKPVEFATFAAAVAEIGLYWMLLNRLPTRETRDIPPR